MKLYTPKNPEETKFLADWVASRIEACQFMEGFYSSLAVVRDDLKILAAVVYSDYKPPNIDMSIAADSPYWARKEMIVGLLSYPFYQLRCTRVTALVNKANKRSRKMIEHVGFRLEGVHPECAADGSTVMSYGLLRKNFEREWLNGKADSPSANAA